MLTIGIIICAFCVSLQFFKLVTVIKTTNETPVMIYSVLGVGACVWGISTLIRIVLFL